MTIEKLMELADEYALSRTNYGVFADEVGKTRGALEEALRVAVGPPDVNRKLLGAMHAAVRKVLQHHGLTKVGDSVLEADLIYAVLEATSQAQHPEVEAVHHRHPLVVLWRNNAIESCASIAEHYYGNKSAARDMRAMLTTSPQRTSSKGTT